MGPGLAAVDLIGIGPLLDRERGRMAIGVLKEKFVAFHRVKAPLELLDHGVQMRRPSPAFLHGNAC